MPLDRQARGRHRAPAATHVTKFRDMEPEESGRAREQAARVPPPPLVADRRKTLLQPRRLPKFRDMARPELADPVPAGLALADLALADLALAGLALADPALADPALADLVGDRALTWAAQMPRFPDLEQVRTPPVRGPEWAPRVPAGSSRVRAPGSAVLPPLMQAVLGQLLLAQVLLAQAVPAQAVPAQAVPAQAVPAQAVPAQAVPAQAVPA